MEFTVVEGYPAPDTWDFADGPSDIYAFALAQDLKFPGWDSSLTSVVKQPTFRFRTSADSGAVTPLNLLPVAFDTTDFNNTGSTLASNTWHQPTGDGQAWWYFGGMIYVVPAATPTVGTMDAAALSITDFNSDTNTSLSYYDCYGDSEQSNTGGEFVQFGGIVKLYGTGQFNVYYANGGSTNATVKAGSLWWGTKLGRV
jgi:hypothetical protein